MIFSLTGSLVQAPGGVREPPRKTSWRPTPGMSRARAIRRFGHERANDPVPKEASAGAGARSVAARLHREAASPQWQYEPCRIGGRELPIADLSRGHS